MKKLIRVTTVPISLIVLLKGQLKFLRNHFKVIGISSSGKELKQAEDNEGIKTYAVDMTRAITPFADLKSLRKLHRIFKNEKPHIVHSHTPKAGTVSMLAAKIAGIKHRIHTVAGLPLLETTGAKRKLLNTVEKATYACATQVLVNSEVLRQIMIKENLAPEKKLKVIGKGSSNGVDIDYFKPDVIDTATVKDIKRHFKILKDDVVFIFVGRMVSDKGVNEMIAAFKDISQQFQNVKLLLLGSREDELNPLKPETESEIKKNPKILEAGFVADVRPYLALSDSLILASYREGFPNVVMQAGAMGKACIVSDINGCNEIIAHKENGIIVPVKNMDKLKEAMDFIINNPKKRQNMGQAARQNVEDKYSQKYVWSEILKFYQSLD